MESSSPNKRRISDDARIVLRRTEEAGETQLPDIVSAMAGIDQSVDAADILARAIVAIRQLVSLSWVVLYTEQFVPGQPLAMEFRPPDILDLFTLEHVSCDDGRWSVASPFGKDTVMHVGITSEGRVALLG